MSRNLAELVRDSSHFQVPCKVTSAAPLSEANVETLKESLGKFLKGNEKLLLETAVSFTGRVIINYQNITFSITLFDLISS